VKARPVWTPLPVPLSVSAPHSIKRAETQQVVLYWRHCCLLAVWEPAKQTVS